MPARRKVRPAGAGAAARRAALRWWLLSLAAAGAIITAAAALLAVTLHVSGLGMPSVSSGAPYRLSQPWDTEELRWEQEFASPQLASSRKVNDSPRCCFAASCRRCCFLCSVFEFMGAYDAGINL